jgi:Domain of unknown function (DUF4136)
MKRAETLLYGIIGIGLLLISCEQEPSNTDLLKDMVVQTTPDNSVNFKTYTTYALPLDTIGQIYNVDPTDTLITGAYGSLVSRQVKKDLDKAGFSRVMPGQNPDLGINVFVLRDFDVYQSVYYPNYYGGYGYPGYYYPGYYGYGGYYSYPSVSTYISNTGTLVIEIIDLKNKNTEGNVRVVWTAYIGDVISSLDRNKKSSEAIDQAFVQSPYIRK